MSIDPKEPSPGLDATIAAAEREGSAHDDAAAAAARARAAAEVPRADGTRWIAGVLAAGLVGAIWWSGRHPAPGTADLDRGRVLTLELAAAAVRDHVARTGRAPEAVGPLLPAASAVRLSMAGDAVELRLDGVEAVMTVPLGPR